MICWKQSHVSMKQKTAMYKHLFLGRRNICMQSCMVCCYFIVFGSWPHFHLLRKILRYSWYAKSRGQRLLHKGGLKVTSVLFWTYCNLCRDALNSLYFLRCCSFVYYELNSTARGECSKDSFRSILPKQWKGGEQEAFLSVPITPIVYRGSPHRPGNLLSPLPLWGKYPCFTEEYNLLVFHQLAVVKQSFYSSCHGRCSAVCPLNQVAPTA